MYEWVLYCSICMTLFSSSIQMLKGNWIHIFFHKIRAIPLVLALLSRNCPPVVQLQLLTYLLISYCSTILKTKFSKIFFGSTKITYRYRCLHLNFAIHFSTSFLHLLACFADHLPTFTYNICKTEKSIPHPIILLN